MQQINDTTGTMRSILRRMVPSASVSNANVQNQVSIDVSSNLNSNVSLHRNLLVCNKNVCNLFVRASERRFETLNLFFTILCGQFFLCTTSKSCGCF